MVFRTLALFARNKGPDEFWRKTKILRMSAHLMNRRRNCYSLAIRAVHKAMMFATRGRWLKKVQLAELWETRLDAACGEHGITPKVLKEGLVRSDILLNRKTLVDLAIWEPRTFKSLAKVAEARGIADGLKDVQNLEMPSEVILRGLMK